jgi:hypothetical protein
MKPGSQSLEERGGEEIEGRCKMIRAGVGPPRVRAAGRGRVLKKRTSLSPMLTVTQVHGARWRIAGAGGRPCIGGHLRTRVHPSSAAFLKLRAASAGASRVWTARAGSMTRVLSGLVGQQLPMGLCQRRIAPASRFADGRRVSATIRSRVLLGA